MDRINDLSAPNKTFVDADLLAGVQGTIVRALYMQDMQEELIGGLIEDVGLTPASGAGNQRLISRGIGRIGRRSQIFAVPGVSSWTVPAGVFRIDILVVGGGGGGSGSPSSGTAWSGSGGGGGWGVLSVDVVPGTVFPVTVGVGGSPGAANGSGGAGGASSLGSLLSATGGQGGIANGGGGVGGTAVGGSANYKSSNGCDGVVSGASALAIGTGHGAPGPFGGNGTAGSINYSASATTAGGGGGGAYLSNGLFGGSGGAGFVSVTW